MKTLQKGFTLIELLIVVAIIGILAAIAIPQYQDYIARSQVSEGIQLIGGAKTAIEESVAQSGAFPTDDGSSNAAGALEDLGIKTSGTYVDKMEATPTAAGSEFGVLETTFAATGVAGGIKSKSISFSRSDAGWTCVKFAAGGTTDTPEKYLPGTCK